MTTEELFAWLQAGPDVQIMMNVANFLNILSNPQLRWEPRFELMRDMRKGGLNPSMYAAFAQDVADLVHMGGNPIGFSYLTDTYKLTDISEKDFFVVETQLRKRAVAFAERCWHPQADLATCTLDATGKAKITHAHSLQENGILSRIAPNGDVTTLNRLTGGFESMGLPKTVASTFRGMCNTHDGVFSPIEQVPYSGTAEQHFLHAYRTFLYSQHIKLETSYGIDFGTQWDADVIASRAIIEPALLSGQWGVFETHAFTLPAMYPIASSGSFYLEFDFDGNAIAHSAARMEFVYVTLLPQDKTTLFLFSYLSQDATLYRQVGDQLRARNNLKLDISALLAPHTENIYYEPVYHAQFIAPQNDTIQAYTHEVQFAKPILDKDGNVVGEQSMTPNDYLQNHRGVQLFGY